jgi:hypothetical protein
MMFIALVRRYLPHFAFTLFASAFLLCSQPAHAGTITVTNTLDNGPGSLRQAVQNAANGDSAVFDSTVFSVPLTITLTSGHIEITKSVLVFGTGPYTAMPTISGNSTSRVISVTAGVTVTLSGLRVAKGYCANCYGAGVFNAGTLAVISSTFVDNAASYGIGDGLYNEGIAQVAGSTFSGNGSTCNGAGGGIANSGVLTLTGSTFTNNCAGSGGGFVNVGVMSVRSTLLSGNSATVGGGLYNSGDLAVTDTTFISNTAAEGGAIIVYPGGALWVTNGTFASNSVRFSGGALLVYDTAHADVLNSTFAGNGAPEGGGILNAGAITLTNTLVADSPSGGNCTVRLGRKITDTGHNLDSSNTCGFTSPGSLTNTNPLLGALGYYGGPVPSLPLLNGSPAIDAGDDASCPANDARGMQRPIGPHCDIGAYEAFNRFWWMPVVQR